MSGRRLRIIAPIVLVGGAVALFFVLRDGGDDGGDLLASGTVEATEADIGFSAGGRIVELLVREGDRVTAAQPLARLDAQEHEARLSAALSQVGIARAQLEELRRGPRREEIAQARAQVAAIGERMENTRRETARARTLFESGAISRQAYDEATTRLAVLESQHTQASEQLGALERGTREERVEAGIAQVQQAEAAVEQADAALAHMTAAAPWPGLVTLRHREVGETVAPGAPVVTVMNPDDRWVRVYIGEMDIARIAPGHEATIHADGLPDVAFRGRVVLIADEAEFTPRNVQTPEERSKLVYAVRVRILDDPELRLKPGLPVDVRFRLADPAGGGAPR
jgi:HlyD family secretion protein